MPKISKGDGMCQRGGGTIYGKKGCERESYKCNNAHLHDVGLV